MDSDKISYIITAFQRPQQTRRSLARLLTFEKKPDEIIVLDDSPDDQTRTFAQEVVKDVPLTYLLRRDKSYGGCALVRNIGFKLAKHENIVIADAEVLSVTPSLQQSLDIFKKNPQEVITAARVYFTGVDTVITDQIITDPAGWLASVSVVEEIKEVNTDLKPSDVYATHGWAAYFLMACKKSWVEEIGGCDEDLTGWGFDDIDFLTRMSVAGHAQNREEEIEVIHQYHPRGQDNSGEKNSQAFFAKNLDKGNKEFLVSNVGRAWGVLNSDEWEVNYYNV